MASEEIARRIPNFIRNDGDGTAEHHLGSSFALPSSDGNAQYNVLSKDVTISATPKVSARLYLPNRNPGPDAKLPILVYFHDGRFCVEFAFSSLIHPFINHLVAEAGAMAVSVKYHLASEAPLPSAYNNCWAALRWVASHMQPHGIPCGGDRWLTGHIDFALLLSFSERKEMAQ